MKAELPTEEDVLAALLVRWMILSPEVGARGFPLMAWAQVPMAVRLVAGHGTDLEVVEAAIADSERRLEVERAQTEVIRAAYFLAAAPGDSQARLRESVYRMNCARREAGMETLP